VIVADTLSGTHLVADRAPQGLERLKPPTLDSIPNNHRFYALQWFFFAAAALVIYGLALRKWWDTPS
jgi:cytochrome oxidase assembly protein ShyY1